MKSASAGIGRGILRADGYIRLSFMGAVIFGGVWEVCVTAPTNRVGGSPVTKAARRLMGRHNSCVPQTHRTKALANPAQPHSALLHELERYIEAHNSDVADVTVVSATDTGQADSTHKPVRHWYHVTYET